MSQTELVRTSKALIAGLWSPISLLSLGLLTSLSPLSPISIFD